MLDATRADKLKDMAEHRGLKLLKSRKRKPGTGDYGMFGLTDAAGTPLFGISDDGLEASAEDVEAYLRAGAERTWKISAVSTRAKLPSQPKPASRNADDEHVASAVRPRRTASATTIDRAARPPSASHKRAPDTSTYPTKPGIRARPTQPASRKHARRAEVEAAAKPPLPPSPTLVIRVAKPADAEALVPLLRELAGAKLDELGVARNLKAALKEDAGVAIAELGVIVGCCAWAVMPTIQHGLVGRLTLLLVAGDYRHRGIATGLLEAAEAALRRAGCARLEAMSDIEVRNAHNFFRTLKFEQTSYRFARTIEPG